MGTGESALSPPAAGPALHGAFPMNTAGPSHRQGLLERQPCSASVRRWGWSSRNAWGCCGLAAGVSSASPHPSQGSPKQGTTTFFRVWQKTQSVFETDINSSLSNNLFAFPAPPPQEALDCAQDYNIVELLQRLHLITKSDGLLQGISYFHINSTGQKKKK